MTKSKIPPQIISMIKTGWLRGHNAVKIQSRINTSKTAKKLGVEYRRQQVAAVMAHITMGTY